MNGEPEAIVNPGEQRAHGERRIRRALGRHKFQHGLGDFVGAVRPAFPRHEAGDPLRVKDGLGLIERRPRTAKRLGRPRHGLAVHVHPAQHFVLHLHEVPGIEEFVGREQRIAYVLRAGMQGALSA